MGLSIAYVSADRGVPVGGTKGASIHVRGVAEALQRRGNRIDILAARLEEEASALASSVREIAFDRTLKQVRLSIAEAGRDPELARELYGLMLNESLTCTLEELHASRPVDALYERYSLWSFAGWRFAQRHGMPWVLEVNAPLVSEQRTYRGLRLEAAARGIEDMMFREADAIVVPCSELRAYIEGRVGPRHAIEVLPNGVDLDLLASPPPLPEATTEPLRNAFVVAFVGSLKPWHGIEHLLNAFERLRAAVPEAHLLVIGDGPLRSEVEAAAARLGPESLTWTGAISHTEVPSWLALADVGVAPYPKLEEFYFSPLKVVEYLAAGLPVVASDIGQIRELVQHGETGFLETPGDAKALAKALRRLHRCPRLRQRMGQRAARRAQRRHSWDGVAQSIEEIFHKLLRQRAARVANPSTREALEVRL